MVISSDNISPFNCKQPFKSASKLSTFPCRISSDITEAPFNVSAITFPKLSDAVPSSKFISAICFALLSLTDHAHIGKRKHRQTNKDILLMALFLILRLNNNVSELLSEDNEDIISQQYHLMRNRNSHQSLLSQLGITIPHKNIIDRISNVTL